MTTTATLLAIPQAAERLALKASTLRAWVFFRKIECVRLSPRAVRISAREVERLIAEGTIPAKGQRTEKRGHDPQAARREVRVSASP